MKPIIFNPIQRSSPRENHPQMAANFSVTSAQGISDDPLIRNIVVKWHGNFFPHWQDHVGEIASSKDIFQVYEAVQGLI